MAEKEAESEAETVETGGSVSTFRVLIQFYKENPLLRDRNHKEYGKKSIITCAVTFLSSDPTICSPSVYCTCHQSLGLVPSPVHTKG